MIYGNSFKKGALDDIEFWKRSGNKKLKKRISELLQTISKNPESGIGKPEKQKGELSGFWSRRINKEHRIIYKAEEKQVVIYALKGHYE